MSTYTLATFSAHSCVGSDLKLLIYGCYYFCCHTKERKEKKEMSFCDDMVAHCQRSHLKANNRNSPFHSFAQQSLFRINGFFSAENYKNTTYFMGKNECPNDRPMYVQSVCIRGSVIIMLNLSGAFLYPFIKYGNDCTTSGRASASHAVGKFEFGVSSIAP